MTDKKLKYLQYLEKFKDCPSSAFKEVDRDAYRWTRSTVTSNDFIPINIISKPPPRMLDDSDKMCMAFGPSMFDTLKNSICKYQKEYKKLRQHQREQFIQDKGSFIAMVNLSKNDGLADEPNANNFGHFTFHEYYQTNLKNKVSKLHSIFLDNGEFSIQ
ncbi:MAG: hypothetical protein ACOVLC_02055 [Flavobacterium sp.]